MSDYTRGTLRKEREPEPIHWAYKLFGMILAMLLLALVGAWIAEGLSI